MPLLDAKGQPIPSNQFAKARPPITGEAFAPRWAGDLDKWVFTLPGGGVVMFDLSKLTLADFRAMRDHYQVNASLAVMTFMIHQMDWKIVCDNPKITALVESNIREIWTPLIRALSQAFWAGYAPNILQWENDIDGRAVKLTKVKDLIPEECWIDWVLVDGWAPPGNIPPKIRVFNGIRSWGSQWPIPVDNSLWWPLLMENGDYFGRKLLRPAFTSWYFSILIHLFSNRYFERFGEPVPIGRAPYDEEIVIPTSGSAPKRVLGADLMVQVLQNLRNRSVVVLPNDRTKIGDGSSGGKSIEYDYNIEYLESQMRGADFERYLTRLDEEISLSLFTPLLILRTADVGSYNLGSTHWNMYLNMLNAVVGDMKYYIDNFVLSRLVDFNFGANAPRARIVFRKMGDDRKEVIMAMLQALMAGGTVKPDLGQLGDIVGLSLSEVKAVLNGNQDPNNPPQNDPGTGKAEPGAKSKTQPGSKSKTSGSSGGTGKGKTAKNSSSVVVDIASRVTTQINKFIRDATPDAVLEPSFGYERQLEASLALDGASDPARVATEMFRFTRLWLQDVPRDRLQAWGGMEIARVVGETLSSKMGDLLDAGW